MEVYYKDYDLDQVARLAGLAEAFDLVPCGGTDYHASGNPGEPGTTTYSVRVKTTVMNARTARCRRRTRGIR